MKATERYFPMYGTFYYAVQSDTKYNDLYLELLSQWLFSSLVTMQIQALLGEDIVDNNVD